VFATVEEGVSKGVRAVTATDMVTMGLDWVRVAREGSTARSEVGVVEVGGREKYAQIQMEILRCT